jgi:hypothetical protein
MNPMSNNIGMHIHLRNVSIFAPLSGKIDDANIWSQKIKMLKNFHQKIHIANFRKKFEFSKKYAILFGLF